MADWEHFEKKFLKNFKIGEKIIFPIKCPKDLPRPNHYAWGSSHHVSTLFTKNDQNSNFCHSTLYYRGEKKWLLIFKSQDTLWQIFFSSFDRILFCTKTTKYLRRFQCNSEIRKSIICREKPNKIVRKFKVF